LLDKTIKISVFILLISSFTLAAEIEEEIIVEAKKLDSISDWKEDVSSTSLNSEEIIIVEAQHPKQIFNRVPGVWISRGSGQEHLTAIRSPVLTGPGACGSFLILEDSVPVRPSGFCNVNGLFETLTESASSLEVIRGPASARYGSNAMHGVINVVSRPLSDINSFSTNIGPDGHQTFKSSVGDFENWRINTLFSSSDGFRDESGYDQQKFHLKNKLELNNWEGVVNVRITNLNQETAGYISGKDIYKDKEESKQNLNPEAYRDANTLKSDIHLSRIRNKSTLSLIPYARKNNMEFLQHYLPGTPVEKNNHSSLGLIVKRITPFQNLEMTSGIQIETAKVKLEEYQASPLTTSSAFNNAVRPQGFHYNYQVDSKVVAFFTGFSDYSFGNSSLLFSDLRIESNKYSYDNRMLTGNTKDDGTLCSFGGCYYSRPEDRDDSFKEVSFRIGVEKNSELIGFFSQISLGFRPPQMTELYRLQKKQTVGDIDSEKLLMMEVGTRFKSKSIEGSVSIYSGKKNDFIFRDSENFIQDHGKTNHRGMELFVRLNLDEKNLFYLAGTLQQHKYDFSSETSMKEKISKGNYVDTAPKTSFNLRWINLISNRLKSEFEVENLGSYYTDAANLHKYEGHTLLHFRLLVSNKDNLKQFIRIHNLLNEDYAERADFNSYGGDRYFPGIPRQVFFGLEYTF